MSTSQIGRFKVLLESRLEALWDRVRNRNAIAIENTADTMDEVRLAEDRDLAIQILGRDFAEIRLVEAALTRIEEGAYGYCLRCDEPIRVNRLCVMPHATFCITCQEAAEHHGFRESSVHEVPTSPAHLERSEKLILESGPNPGGSLGGLPDRRVRIVCESSQLDNRRRCS
jgi:DnaK suppressor protein